MGARHLLWTVTLTVFLFLLVDLRTALATPVDETPQGDEASTPEVLKQSESFIVAEGESLRMPCNMKVYSYAPMWYKGAENDTLLFLEDAPQGGAEKNYSVVKENGALTLIIHKVTPETTGLYTCYSQPKYFTTHTVQIKVNVDIVVPKNIEVGGNLMLSCKVTGHPEPTVAWYRKKTSGSSQTELIGSVADMTISNVSASDSGTYTCTATNEFDNATKSIPIKVVNGLSAENDEVFVDVQKNEATICCNYHKGPANSLHWLKDGNDVPLPSSRINVMTHGKLKQCLSIRDVEEKDLGVYTCKTVKTKGPVEKASTNLTGAPQVPKLDRVTAESMNSSSPIPVLRWKVGTFSPLLSYEIYVRKQEDTEWKLYVSQPVISDDKDEVIERKFDQLPNGQYATKLIVRNKHGSSELISEDMPLSVDVQKPVDSGKGEAGRNFAHAGVLVIAILTTLLLCR